jgi:hypothetical protein
MDLQNEKKFKKIIFEAFDFAIPPPLCRLFSRNDQHLTPCRQRTCGESKKFGRFGRSSGANPAKNYQTDFLDHLNARGAGETPVPDVVSRTWPYRPVQHP